MGLSLPTPGPGSSPVTDRLKYVVLAATSKNPQPTQIYSINDREKPTVTTLTPCRTARLTQAGFKIGPALTVDRAAGPGALRPELGLGIRRRAYASLSDATRPARTSS